GLNRWIEVDGGDAPKNAYKEMDLVQMELRGKRRTKGATITPDSKLLFVIRIGG
ncbi:hypothetical protein FXO38_34190, partial [Capsicum annuum]